MTPSDSAGNQPVSAAGTAVYRDAHETSLTLTVLGGVIAVGDALGLAWNSVGLEFNWLMAAAVAIGFAALWLTFRRRADARRMRPPPGFGIAAIIAGVAIGPPFMLFLVFAGPFISFGVALTVAGLQLGNRVLTFWAVGVGSAGVLEGFFGITNRLPAGIWADWEHPAIFVLLGAITCLAGIIIGIRERGHAR